MGARAAGAMPRRQRHLRVRDARVSVLYILAHTVLLRRSSVSLQRLKLLPHLNLLKLFGIWLRVQCFALCTKKRWRLMPSAVTKNDWARVTDRIGERNENYWKRDGLMQEGTE
jgi:hypothetical protein